MYYYDNFFDDNLSLTEKKKEPKRIRLEPLDAFDANDEVKDIQVVISPNHKNENNTQDSIEGF